MAKRSKGKNGKQTETAASTSSMADDLESKVVAFSEQLGRIVGTVQARTEGWLDRDSLNRQVSQVRDSAMHLLDQIAADAASSRVGTATAAAGKKILAAAESLRSPAVEVRKAVRSRGPVDAPGKKHRKPVPNPKRAHAADAGLVANMKIARTERRGGR